MKALMLLLVSGILTAGVFIIGKQAGSESVSPLLILFWQLSGGALVVWVVSWPSRKFPRWDAEHIRYYLFGGLLGVSLPYVLAFVVLRELQMGIVGLFTALSPVVTYALARLLGHEQGSLRRLLGLIAGFSGVAFLVMPKDGVDLSGHWMFMLLALAIPVTLAVSNIYRSRFWPKGSEAISLVIGMLTVQGISLFFINLALGNFHDAMPMTQDLGLLLIVLGLMAGASYLSSFNLLRVGGPVYLSQMGYVITVVTLLAGIVMWGERYGGSELLSMGLVFSGVLLTTLTQRLQQPTKTAPVLSGR
jgi:drug/metabolite transporter (DMT)-like permease